MRARGEAAHAGAGEVARRGLEVPALDAGDRLHDDFPAALEVAIREHPLAIFLEPRRLPDAEDPLADRPPHPFLRIPERKEAGLVAQRFALVVEAEPACEVV